MDIDVFLRMEGVTDFLRSMLFRRVSIRLSRIDRKLAWDRAKEKREREKET